MPQTPTDKDAIFEDGTATLYRFRGESTGPVVLLVPSMINRWYVLDLRKGASIAEAFVEAGFNTFLLDWGIPQDEDRYLSWDDVVARLHRMVRRTKRFADVQRIGLMGYCMGGTLCGIYTALYPDNIAALTNLAGPFNFDHAGLLGNMVDSRWFDADAIADAGSVTPKQMQDGFVAMRPTGEISKWVTYADRGLNAKFRESFGALNEWASDNIPFPAEAYRTYIKDLYQNNLLMKGEHYVAGRRADLGNITCPVLSIAATRDHICPKIAAMGLVDRCGSQDKTAVVVKGGHVGAVVGSRAKTELYPKMTDWFADKLSPSLTQPAASLQPPAEAGPQ